MREVVWLYVALICLHLHGTPAHSLHRTCKPAAKDRPIVFLHNAKCAGTAAKGYLLDIAAQSGVSEDRFCDSLDIPRLLYQHPSDVGPVRNCDFVVGHVAYGLAEGFNELRDPYYTTVFRDPLDRTRSLYDYVLQNPSHHQYNTFSKHTLSELIEIAYKEHIENPSLADWNNSLVANNRIVWRICGYFCRYQNMTQAEATAIASKRLMNDISVIGIVEEMASFVRALYFFTNKTQYHTDTGESTSSIARKSTFAPQDRVMLEKILAPEISIYSRAVLLMRAQQRCLRRHTSGVHRARQSIEG